MILPARTGGEVGLAFLRAHGKKAILPRNGFQRPILALPMENS